MTAIKLLLLVPAGYLTFYSFYWLFTILLGMMYRPRRPDLLNILMGVMTRPKRPGIENLSNPEMLLILPAYRPGEIFTKVLASVQQAIEQRNIRVYVLLQEADPHYRQQAEAHGFIVEEKKFSHLPGNSYHHALHHIVDRIQEWKQERLYTPHFVMLIDKDNVLSPDFFRHITPQQYQQYDVMQAKRSSINAEGDVSFFDTISEGLNDTMFRAAKSLIRGAIEISGSGALIKTKLFVETIRRLDSRAPGYDKNFMVQILSASYAVKTTYFPYMQLHEEKTADIESHNPQRVRWFAEQYYNALYSAGKLLRAFVRYRRFSAFEYLVVLWRPPRSLQILLVPLLGLIELAAYGWQGFWWLGFPYLVSSTLALMAAAFLFLIRERLLLRSLRYAIKLPKLALNNMLNAGNSIKKENHGTFIHTEHKL
jgi:cellulose synthase/poly-beta-1,6-N-acetylglucosamine synthase-like glycosyltransferase